MGGRKAQELELTDESTVPVRVSDVKAILDIFSKEYYEIDYALQFAVRDRLQKLLEESQ